jgi:hypothetical protein
LVRKKIRHPGAPRATIHEDLGRKDQLQRLSDRTFGFGFAVVFLVISLFPLLRGDRMRWWATAVSGVFLVSAVVRPSVLGPANTLWLAVNRVVRRILTPVLMGLVFYLVVTPFGLVMRLFGRDPLGRKLEPAAQSYWIDRPAEARDMRNQF